jgi:hypothetical protein
MNGTVLYIFCVGIYVRDGPFKGILSTICVIFSYPKLLSISVLTFIKWRSDRLYLCKAIIAINQMQEKNHNYQQRLQ